MSNSEKSDNCGKNQPLNNTFLITDFSEDLFQVLRHYRHENKNYPSVVVLRHISKEEVESIAQKIADEFFAGVISSKDIISNIDPLKGSIRNSNRRHPLHVDGTFELKNVPAFALFFQKTDPLGGGASIFKPTKYILNLLGDKYTKTLTKYPVVFGHKNEDGFIDRTHPTYAIKQNADGKKELRYAWDDESNMLPSGILEEEQRIQVWDAINYLRRCVSICPQITYQAQEGDFVFVLNYEMLHGREEILSQSERIIYRWYFGVNNFFRGLDKFIDN